MPKKHAMSCCGFTLIELLIVVAIIAILSAIAVPNFLEAQTRAKAARVVADMRTIAIAIEAYGADYDHYPPEHNPDNANQASKGFGDSDSSHTLFRITSPFAYIISTKSMEDPFQTNTQQGDLTYGPLWKTDMKHYLYADYETWDRAPRPIARPIQAFGLASLGPDHNDSHILWGPAVDVSEPTLGDFLVFALGPHADPNVLSPIYDASNGTSSPGDIARFGGMVPSRTSKYLNGYSGTN